MRPYAWIKRFIDIVLSLILFIPASLIIVVCCVAIKVETKGPAFFVQTRPGYKGKIFKIFKLRTMIIETEKEGRELSDVERMTKIGRILRTCSFDELPQILNILLGQMSFIGPRPLLTCYLPLYSSEQMRRHDVLPGISGWAQVNGRNELSWEQKFKRDVWYVEHMSAGLDCEIFWMTIISILKHQGINAGVNETMPGFTGMVSSGGGKPMVDRQQKSPVHVVIIGASGHARVIADIVNCSGDVVDGFLDDRDASDFSEVGLLGKVEDASRLARENPNLRFIIGIGNNSTREAIAKKLSDLPYHIAIHPSAVLAGDCSLGLGTVVMPNAVINTGSKIGRHCIINTAATVDHDCEILDFAHLSPGVHLSGMVKVGRCTWLGVGSLVSNNINICDSCTIGAGAVVIKDIDKTGTYVGIPAHILPAHALE